MGRPLRAQTAASYIGVSDDDERPSSGSLRRQHSGQMRSSLACQCRQCAVWVKVIIGVGILVAVNALLFGFYLAPASFLGPRLHEAKVQIHTVVNAAFTNPIDLTARVGAIKCMTAAYGGGSNPRLSPAHCTPPGVGVVSALHHQQKTLPWLLHDVSSLPRDWKGGRGVVMVVGDREVEEAVTLLRSLRETLRSTLPVDVYYVGEETLSLEQQQRISRIPGVAHLLDLRRSLASAEWHALHHHARPFATLFSDLSEVVLLGPSVVLLHPPELFFNEKGYKETGSLFFRDRCTAGAPGPNGVRRAAAVLGVPFSASEVANLSSTPGAGGTAAALQAALNLCADVQDAGVVVIDKKRQFPALLAVAMLNDLESRGATTALGSTALAEKETWWLGHRVMGASFAFDEHPGGVIGVRRGGAVCASSALHTFHVLGGGAAAAPSWWRGITEDSLPSGYSSGKVGKFASWGLSGRDSPPAPGSEESNAVALCVPLRAGGGARDGDFDDKTAALIAAAGRIFEEEHVQ